MNRKPSTKLLISLFNNLEKELAKENWSKVIKNCEVFTGIVKAYVKTKKDLNKERI